MSKLFISYSKQNKEYAHPLKAKLIEEGFDVWMDDVIEPSDNWWRSIRQAIRECEAFILIMTHESENSHWVEQELAYALELKKPFFPLLRSGNSNLVLSDVWSRFASIQAIDVSTGELPSDSFYLTLKKRIGFSSDFITASTSPQSKRIVLDQFTMKSMGQSYRFSSLGIMPNPFNWIDIPVGTVTLGAHYGGRGGYIKDPTQFDVNAFSIAKYPITNAQFNLFIKSDGYYQEKWWTEEGWDVRQKSDWNNPAFWSETKIKKADYPVVGVSWYEAVAFCKWLSAFCSEDISLPTDQQ